MSTRLAPNCAAGEIMDILSQSLNQSHVYLLRDPIVLCCSRLDIGKIMRGFATLRRHISFYFTMKLSFWRQIPWVLFGLAHSVRSKAVECAKRALSLAAATPRALLHPLAVKICLPGTICYAQIVAFINGADILSLPSLCWYVAGFRFATIVERWIEARHAIVNKILAGINHASMQHIAFFVSLPQMHDILSDDVANLNAFAAHCVKCRNPILLLQTLGLWDHPEIRRIHAEEGNRMSQFHFRRRREVVEVLYHCDANTLFSALPQHRPDDNDDGNGGGGGGGGGGPPSAGGAPPTDAGSNGGGHGGSGSGGQPPTGGGDNGGGAGNSGSGGPPPTEFGKSGGGSTSNGGGGPPSNNNPPSASSCSGTFCEALSQGSLHDTIWCKHILELLRSLVSEAKDQHGSLASVAWTPS